MKLVSYCCVEYILVEIVNMLSDVSQYSPPLIRTPFSGLIRKVSIQGINEYLFCNFWHIFF